MMIEMMGLIIFQQEKMILGGFAKRDIRLVD
jgi:hypothetical protein